MTVGFIPAGFSPGGPADRTFEFGVEMIGQSFMRLDAGTGAINGQISVARVESDRSAAEAVRLSTDHEGRPAVIQDQDGFVFTGPGNNAVAVWATPGHIVTVSATGLTEADVVAVADSVTIG